MPSSRLWVGTLVMSLPSSLMAPLVGSSRPATMRIRVVLPQPDGPSRQTKVPCGTVSSTFLTAVKAELLDDILEGQSGHWSLRSALTVLGPAG
jgi:hypothetical protein